jgi:hypothetical protein
MMAINLGAVAIGKILATSPEFSDITISCYNSPDDHVVSGPTAGLRTLKPSENRRRVELSKSELS